MKLVFVHGWGFDQALWRGVQEALPQYETLAVERGFLGGEPTHIVPQTDDILIGHSMGLLWGLAQRQDWRAVIAINSFAQFAGKPEEGACVRPAALRAMRLGLARDAAATLAKFYRSLGYTSDGTPFDVQRLREGLALLETLQFVKPAEVPMLVLAARNDPLVPASASEHLAALGGTTVQWQEEGGHLLPLTQAQWCADAIAAFLA